MSRSLGYINDSNILLITYILSIIIIVCSITDGSLHVYVMFNINEKHMQAKKAILNF